MLESDLTLLFQDDFFNKCKACGLAITETSEEQRTDDDGKLSIKQILLVETVPFTLKRLLAQELFCMLGVWAYFQL